MSDEDHYPLLFHARALLRKNATFFTVKEMLVLLQLTADGAVSDETRGQMLKDVVTYPYYDCVATWLDTEAWRNDECIRRIIVSFLETPRRKDQIALSKHRAFGKRLRVFIKANGYSRSFQRFLYSKFALSEALWRRRHPNPRASDLGSFLAAEIEKLERSLDQPD